MRIILLDGSDLTLVAVLATQIEYDATDSTLYVDCPDGDWVIEGLNQDEANNIIRTAVVQGYCDISQYHAFAQDEEAEDSQV